MTRMVYRFGGGVSDGEAGRQGICSAARAPTSPRWPSIGLPVPPGFTIATEACALYDAEGEGFRDALAAEVAEGIAHIEQATGKSFGDAADPLLVSVRSGARVSMPGMMDTVLNLGLNDATVAGPRRRLGRSRASPGTATAASSRCMPTSSWASTTACSRRRSRSPRRTRASISTPSWRPRTGSG